MCRIIPAFSTRAARRIEPRPRRPGLARDEQLVLPQRAVEGEQPGLEPRDVPRPLAEEAVRVALADQPVPGQHVGAEVVAQEDHPAPLAVGPVQDLPAADLEEALQAVIRLAVEQQVAGPAADEVAGQVPADGGDVPGAAEVVPFPGDRPVEAEPQAGHQGVLGPADARQQARGRPGRQDAEQRQDRPQ
jgi:hypothetical protein